MTQATRMNWKVPLALLALSAVPLAAGIARLGSLAGAAEVSTDNARFVAAPLPVLLHIVGASLFSVLGALQFSAALRTRWPRWHRLGGRIVVAGGMVAALSGLWMTLLYPIPTALQGDLLYGVRIVVGVAMLLSLAKAVAAVMAGNIGRHRVWMVHAYALGLGAGTQVVLLLPWMLLIGTPGMLERDLLMSLAWLINLLLAHFFLSPFFKRYAP
jgi:uncharacterized membrane protein